MPRDLIIKSDDPAVTLNVLGEMVKTAENNPGGYGFINEGSGVVHLLLQDADNARHILASNRIPVSEEHDVLIIIADVGGNTSLKLNGIKKDTSNIFVVKVPENGSVEINTHIEVGDDSNQDARRCSHIIFDMLGSLGLNK